MEYSCESGTSILDLRFHPAGRRLNEFMTCCSLAAELTSETGAGEDKKRYATGYRLMELRIADLQDQSALEGFNGTIEVAPWR